MHGLTKAINKFKKQCATNNRARSSAPTLHKRDSVNAPQAEVNYTDASSEASFHSALNSQNSPSPSPASSPSRSSLSEFSITQGPVLSNFTVQIPSKAADVLAQYDTVTLNPQDEHFASRKPPSDTSQAFAMGSAKKALVVTTPSVTSEDSFEDSLAYEEPAPQETYSGAARTQSTPTRQLFSARQPMHRAGMPTPQTGASMSVSKGFKDSKSAVNASKEKKASTSTFALASPTRSKATRHPKPNSSKAIQIDSDCEIANISYTSKTQKTFGNGDTNTPHASSRPRNPKYSTKVANALASPAAGQAPNTRTPNKRNSSKSCRRLTSVTATKADTHDVDADSDFQIVSAAVRDGGDAQRPVTFDSDVEVIKSNPFKRNSSVRGYNRGAKTVGRRRVPSASRVKSERQNATSPIPTVEKTRCEIDLTMLSSSDSSDCVSDDESVVPDVKELTNVQALPGRNIFNDLAKPDPVSVAGSYHGPGNDRSTNNHASLPPNNSYAPGQRERATSPSPASAPASNSEQPREVTPVHEKVKSDGCSKTRDECAGQTYDPYDDHDKRNWPMFDYRFMSPPQTTPMLDKAEACRRARAESEKRKTHELVNEERWRNDEGYIPCESADQKRKFESDDDSSEVKAALKKRKLNEIVASAITAAYIEGIAPFHVRRKRNESDVVFASRLSDFKVGGWKKHVVVSKQRKLAQRAKCANKYLARVCSEETHKVKAEVLKREGFLETLVEN